MPQQLPDSDPGVARRPQRPRARWPARRSAGLRCRPGGRARAPSALRSVPRWAIPGRSRLAAMRGRDRSPAAALVDAVADYVVDPTDRTAAHRAIEVFPAPSWIALFGLERAIVYKKGRKVQRIEGLTRIRALIDGLAEADLPLVGPTRRHPRDAGREQQDDQGLEGRRGHRRCSPLRLHLASLGQDRYGGLGRHRRWDLGGRLHRGPVFQLGKQSGRSLDQCGRLDRSRSPDDPRHRQRHNRG